MCLGLWEEIWASGGNPCRYRGTRETPHRQVSVSQQAGSNPKPSSYEALVRTNSDSNSTTALLLCPCWFITFHKFEVAVFFCVLKAAVGSLSCFLGNPRKVRGDVETSALDGKDTSELLHCTEVHHTVLHCIITLYVLLLSKKKTKQKMNSVT